MSKILHEDKLPDTQNFGERGEEGETLELCFFGSKKVSLGKILPNLLGVSSLELTPEFEGTVEFN